MNRKPFYRQPDSKDCGPSCIKIISMYYGYDYHISLLREMCHVDGQGCSMLDIYDASVLLGYNVQALKLDLDDLELKGMPSIIHWNSKHFVVCLAVRRRHDKRYVIISDPSSGVHKLNETDFLRSWTGDNEFGAAVFLTLGDEMLQASACQKQRRTEILGFITPYRRQLALMFCSLLLGSVISLIIPFITQSVVDRGIENKSLSVIAVLLLLQFFLVLGKTVNDILRSRLSLRVTNKVSISLVEKFLHKLVRLPISFFEKKGSGDILQRIGDNARIQTFLTNSLLSIIFAIVSFLSYSCVMAYYNIRILLVFLMGSVIYVAWTIVFIKKRRELDYLIFTQSSINQNGVLQIVEGIQEIKLLGKEHSIISKWKRQQMDMFDLRVKSQNITQIQKTGSVFIDQSKNILITYFSAKAVIDGGMSLGMMMAIQYVIGQLNAPVSQFASFINDFQDASLAFERLSDVQQLKEEDDGKDGRISVPEDSDIIFNNVSMRYGGANSRLVLKDVSFTIPCGRTTAIVGASGSGKSTLLKLMLGLYHPNEGEILLGGYPLDDYVLSEWRAKCAAVMQNGFVFADTVASNITMSDEDIDEMAVKEAAQKANIASYIESLPAGYDTNVGLTGKGISEGQKQRLLLARVMFRDAPYVFLDEATNSLDSENEKAILDNLRPTFHGKTIVVVAHRLSTIVKADNIVVMKGGRIVGQGKHDELYKNNKTYKSLVDAQSNIGR